jgi:hypothetical protein
MFTMKNLRANTNIIFLLLFASFCSCEQYLEITPKDQVSDNSAWAFTESADLFLLDIYSTIRGPFNTPDPEENWSDNAMAGVPSYYSVSTYANSIYTPSDAQGYWDQYTAIRKTNVFIQKVTASTLPDSWKKTRLAEARFLRAYFYHLLWTHYGGVPIITDVLDRNTQGDGIFRPRNSDEETYKFIVDECAAISEDLPVKAESGRITKGAALTLKGWCELFAASALKNPGNDKSKWALAAATNKQVIDLKAYSLFPDYGTMFYEENNNNAEVIFARQYLGGTALGGSREGLQGPWRAPSGIQRAYGGVNPTQELVDQYTMANGLPITDPASGYDPEDPYKDREKRFYQSIVYDGSFWLGFEMVMKQGLGSSNETDRSDKNEATNTGYYLRKGLNPKYTVNGNNRLNSASFIIFRYAEVLLSYAEAQNEAVGPDASVYDAINKVRVRSELPPLAQGLSQEEMRAAIQRERRVELAFEERRWYDLIRCKSAEVNLNSPVHAMLIENVNGSWKHRIVPAAGGGRTFHSDRNYVLPIPQAAIDRNVNLIQNPNY